MRTNRKSSEKQPIRLEACSIFTETFQLEILETREVLTASVAREWNEALLDAIRRDVPNPPIHARNLFHLSAAMYDAWSVYDPISQGYITKEKQTAVDPEAARNEAISYASYRVLSERFSQPKSVGWVASTAQFDALMVELGYDKNVTTTVGTSPAAIGNRIGYAMLQYGFEDGANELNFYQDVTGYQTVNPNLIVDQPWEDNLVDPNRWQKLSLTSAFTQNGLQTSGNQPAIGTNARWVKPFALTRSNPLDAYDDPGAPPLLGGVGDAALKDQVVEMILLSSQLDPANNTIINISPGVFRNNPLGADTGTGHGLNPVTGLPYADNFVNQADYGRVIAEYWADGPQSETPPGHWNVIANRVSDDPLLVKQIGGVGPVVNDLEWDIKLYFSLNGAVHDAATAAWGVKYIYDGARPITYVRHMANLGQSSDPFGPSYNVNGLPLVPGLIEVITLASSAPGERHEALAGSVGKIAIKAWGGNPANPATEVAGAVWQLGTEWVPFQRSTFVTPAFPGYVSGHSTFSRSAAEVMTQFTGSPYFPGGYDSKTFNTDYLLFEDGPTAPITIGWASYYDAADEAGQSRRWGGIHINADDFAGRLMGSEIGTDAFNLADQYFDGTVALPSLRAGGEYTLIDGNALQLRASVDTTLDANTIEWDLNNDNVFGDVVGGQTLVSWATLQSFGVTSGPNNYPIQVRASDGLGGPYVVQSTWLNLFNKKPVANPGGPYTIQAGDSLTLNASASFDPVDSLTYTWDVNGDGVFGDATGVNPTLSPAQLASLNIYGNPKSFAVSVRVDDGKPNGIATASTTLSLVNFQPYTLNVNSGLSSLSVSGTYTPSGGSNEPILLQAGSLPNVSLSGTILGQIGASAIRLNGGTLIAAANQGGLYSPGNSDANLAIESTTSGALLAALRSLILDASSGVANLATNGNFTGSLVDFSLGLGSVIDLSENGGPDEQFDLSSLGLINNVASVSGSFITEGNFWKLTVPVDMTLTVTTTLGGVISLRLQGQIVATTALPAFNDVAPAILPISFSPLEFPGGGAVGDFDGDGLPDLFLTRRTTSPSYILFQSNPTISALYRNKGDGTFQDVTVGSGIDIPMFANGANWADLDNDGDLDLYVTSYLDIGNADSLRNYLFINDGTGHFTEQGLLRNAAIARDSSTIRWTEGVSFGDFDRDGYLDILVAEFSFADENPTHAPFSRLLRNRGAAQPGHFDDVTVAAGISLPLGRTWGTQVGYSSKFADLDNDGWQDIILTGDWGTSRLFWNNHDGTFTDGTVAAGIGGESFGMGTAVGDVNGDGLYDYFVTSIYAPGHPIATGNRLYLNNGDRTFSDATDTYGVRAGQWAWGAEFLDFDNDGKLDLLQANGFDDIAGVATDPEIGDIDVVANFMTDPTHLWRNVGGTMVDVAASSGILDNVVGRGVVHIDYDQDGDLDLIILNDRSRPVIYRNNLSNGNGFLSLKLQGSLSNRQGIGARIAVYLESSSDPIVREVNGSSNYRGSSDSLAHFGLGTGSDPIHKILITWPSGLVQQLDNVARNSRLTVNEADAIPAVAFLAPSEPVLGYPETFILNVDRQVPVVGDYTFSIDWNNDNVIDQTVIGPSGTIVSHTFSQLGPVDVRISAVGPDNIAATSQTQSLNVVHAGVRTSLTNPLVTNLYWTGSDGIDEAEFISLTATSIQANTATYNGVTVNQTQTFTGITGGLVALGQSGNDSLNASQVTSNATLQGGAGNDFLKGGSAADQLFGNEDADTIWGGLGSDQIVGGSEGDLIFGDHPTGDGRILSKTTLGHDTIDGESGNDIIYGDGDGGEGTSDSISGGDGDDTINADGSEGAISVAGDFIDGGDNNDVITADGAEGSPDTIYGSGGNDVIYTGGGNDFADGGADNDMLFGDSASTGANDTLLGGPGNDILIGDGGIPGSGRVATGTDSIEGGAGEDLIITGLVAGLPGGFDWFAVQNEWLNGGSLAQRQAHILGTTPGGLNGTHKLFPGVNIINDGSPGEPAIDIVLAGDQSDWILWDEVNDQLVDPNVEDSLLDISLYL